MLVSIQFNLRLRGWSLANDCTFQAYLLDGVVKGVNVKKFINVKTIVNVKTNLFIMLKLALMLKQICS